MPPVHKFAHVAILASKDEGLTWNAIKPEEVPEFVKDPNVMGDLIDSPDYCVHDLEVSPLWFRAVTVKDPRLVGNQLNPSREVRLIVPPGFSH